MLSQIVNIINNSNSNLSVTTLLCEYKIDDLAFFELLQKEAIIENITTTPVNRDDQLTLEFSILKLQSLGFFTDKSSFVKKYRYHIPQDDVYIFELKQYLKETEFYPQYKSIVNLILEIENNAKHTYEDAGIKNAIIFREDRSLLVSFLYESELLTNKNSSFLIDTALTIFRDNSLQDKKNIYLNELVDFCFKYPEEIRFSSLVNDFEQFINNSNSTYNFYLRNFSYNKLKLEIDSKAIEFNQKLQSVINDSQTKLIAIPTAFVLVLSSLNFEKIDDPKNIISTAGLFIFSSLLQLFVNNQKSTIKFISENINYYKSTFKDQDRKEVEKSFIHVNSEKNKQVNRLILIETLLWLVPIFVLSLLLFLTNYQLIAVLILFFYLWVASNKLLLKY
ncbi:hypothetical protein G4D82_12500 [Flavobacterium sp. CYK-4]|uniref:hypothetical protein n=1 Tax=Flavobacterium lotistagni TaxID=2709660 RepID=UPI00140776D9|nr:hypothetical protein [Flavobacterium lotistagni]NHM08044.1 hypothetical protein [Flavobacterium lotistagni]